MIGNKISYAILVVPCSDRDVELKMSRKLFCMYGYDL